MKEHNQPKHIYFVRHGESEANISRVPGGHSVILSQKGEEQAEKVGRRFANIPVDVIISSPFVRAQQTAEYMQRYIDKPIEQSDLFIERRGPSEVMGKPAEDPIRKKVAEIERSNLVNGESRRYSDEELFAEVVKRADDAIAFIKNREESNIAIVSHGLFLKLVVFRMVLGDYLTPQVYHEVLHGFSTWNTGITYAIWGDDDRFHVRQWNDSAHLGELRKGETRKKS